jgi:RNA-directed DNA polymerase
VASHVAEHTGRACLLRLDLRDFFASITRRRVRAVFAALGHPRDVADLLATLCTTATPYHVRRELDARGAPGRQLAERLREAHLPQGAPTSPALANLVAFALDRRLTGLARRFGCHYTRYADDLLFSGDATFACTARRCADHVAAIALDEGFTVQHHKTRVLRRGQAQRACGLVLNAHAAVPRRDRERLEAILHHCVVDGPSTQNRDGVPDLRATLHGRIAWVAHVHPPHAERLWDLFARIDWRR